MSTEPSSGRGPSQSVRDASANKLFGGLESMLPAGAVLDSQTRPSSYLSGGTLEALAQAGMNTINTLVSTAFHKAVTVAGKMPDTQFMATYFGGATHSPNNPNFRAEPAAQLAMAEPAARATPAVAAPRVATMFDATASMRAPTGPLGKA